jgi:transcriptional regulator with PAS, ATPase and Fis domain
VEALAMILGKCAVIEKLREDISYAARADAKVLITGESGAGKELVARAIHAASTRQGGPFMAINCAGIPETLLESELFGYVRGSFTGAYRDRAGLLESGHRGTVFLDEVGEMTLRMQGLLLRFLETGEIQRIGADRAVQRLDVRVVAATNRPLTEDVEEKRFRSDLYYRLNVIHLCVPPLRDRREDIPMFLSHFMEGHSRRYSTPPPEITPQAMALLTAYDWPGNVRELKNVVERLFVRRHRVVTPEVLPDEIAASQRAAIAVVTSAPAGRISARESILGQLLQGRESFWSAVYDPFMSRDLTREDLRAIVRAGLEQTRGSYTALTQLFNMEPSDYKRFLNFLRKHQCHMPFHSFRMAPVAARAESAARQGAA